jgi:hypothetical protein
MFAPNGNAGAVVPVTDLAGVALCLKRNVSLFGEIQILSGDPKSFSNVTLA